MIFLLHKGVLSLVNMILFDKQVKSGVRELFAGRKPVIRGQIFVVSVYLAVSNCAVQLCHMFPCAAFLEQANC